MDGIVHHVKIHDGVLPAHEHKKPRNYTKATTMGYNETLKASDQAHLQQLGEFVHDEVGFIAEEVDHVNDEPRLVLALQLVQLLELFVQKTLYPSPNASTPKTKHISLFSHSCATETLHRNKSIHRLYNGLPCRPCLRRGH